MDMFRLKSTAIAAFILAGIVWSPSLPIPAAASTMAAGVGCANVWAFNGVWRVRVAGFAPHIDGGRQTGWEVTETWRNGTAQQLNGPRDSFQKSQVLRLQGGAAINVQDNTPAVLSQQALDYHVFPPSAQFTHTQLFAANTIDPNSKPESVVISFDTGKLAKATDLPKFTVSPPDFTIKFDCSPAELAKATSAGQGGSYEVQAHEGCANQGVSDGNWSVRVTRVELGSDPGQSTPTGWNVTEEWKNLSGRKLAPSGHGCSTSNSCSPVGIRWVLGLWPSSGHTTLPQASP